MGEITIHDVAKAAGVSTATVSRALNNGSVRESTRKRVRKIADQLGYHPNIAARDLTSGRFGRGNIAVFVTDVSHFYFTDVFTGLFAKAQATGYRLFVTDLELTNDVEQTVTNVISNCEGQILVSPRISDAMIRKLFPVDTTVLANRRFDGYSSVCVDDRSGILQAIRHLASLGHKRIAYVSGSSQSWSNHVRSEAFEEGCEHFGVECVVLGPFEQSYSGGVNAGDALLLEADVTAVLVFNDLVASGLMACLIERGVSIPRDMSVVGIDASLLSLALRPQLTTVDVRHERMGREAVQLLLDLLEAHRDGLKSDVISETVPEILITRDSTAAPCKQ